jgi:cytochrome c oxidase assembly protein subunit 11
MPLSDDELVRKNKRLGLTVMAVVIGMIGLSYYSVKLYELFCQVTGFGGKAVLAAPASGEIIDRDIVVKFNTDVSPGLDWSFKADQPSLTVKIGQEALVSFTATNNSDKPVAGTSLFNVLPEVAGKYFQKTQCFCFDYQMIAPGQSAHFPVVFYIDPALARDREADTIKSVTLSYTFFKADSKELERALEAFYNDGKSANKAVPR